MELWHYKDKRRVALGLAEELSIGVPGQIDAARRHEASWDSREGLAERARKGFSAGGVRYGFTNKPVMGRMASGQEMRLYTDLVINDAEADVVRRIFRMYAEGHGPRRIAKTLNGDRKYAAESARYFDSARPPKPIIGKRGSGSWAPSAIREMLRNERYVGVISFGKYKNDYDEDGVKGRAKQADTSIIRTDRPDLRIVSPALWHAAQRRIGSEQQHYLRTTQGLLHGRPTRGLASPRLLSGFLRCACCGSNMVASS